MKTEIINKALEQFFSYNLFRFEQVQSLNLYKAKHNVN